MTIFGFAWPVPGEQSAARVARVEYPTRSRPSQGRGSATSGFRRGRPSSQNAFAARSRAAFQNGLAGNPPSAVHYHRPSARTRPRARHRSRLTLLLALLSLAGCGGAEAPTTPPPPPPTVATSVAVAGGDQQTARIGSAVSVAPSVVVKDQSGHVMAGVQVTFAVSAGGGQASGATAITDANGVAPVSCASVRRRGRGLRLPLRLFGLRVRATPGGSRARLIVEKHRGERDGVRRVGSHSERAAARRARRELARDARIATATVARARQRPVRRGGLWSSGLMLVFPPFDGSPAILVKRAVGRWRLLVDDLVFIVLRLPGVRGSEAVGSSHVRTSAA